MLSSALVILILLAADPVTYVGRQVKVVDPGTEDPDGFFPKGEAKVCVQGQQEKDCYTAPKGVGRMPSLSVVALRKGESALFFEAASGGVSGFPLHFALLKFCDRDRFPGCGVDEFKNLLPYALEVSESESACMVGAFQNFRFEDFSHRGLQLGPLGGPQWRSSIHRFRIRAKA